MTIYKDYNPHGINWLVFLMDTLWGGSYVLF